VPCTPPRKVPIVPDSSSGSPQSRQVVRWFSIGMFGSAILLIAYVVFMRRPEPPFEVGASVVAVQGRAARIEMNTSDPLFVYLLFESADTTTYALSPRRSDGPHSRLPAGRHEVVAEPLPRESGNLVLIAARSPVWWIDEAIHKLPKSAVAPVLERALFVDVPLPKGSAGGDPSLRNVAGPTRLARPLEEGTVTIDDVWIRKTRIEPNQGL